MNVSHETSGESVNKSSISMKSKARNYKFLQSN
jgi:hypothetical protein